MMHYGGFFTEAQAKQALEAHKRSQTSLGLAYGTFVKAYINGANKVRWGIFTPA